MDKTYGESAENSNLIGVSPNKQSKGSKSLSNNQFLLKI